MLYYKDELLNTSSRELRNIRTGNDYQKIDYR